MEVRDKYVQSAVSMPRLVAGVLSLLYLALRPKCRRNIPPMRGHFDVGNTVLTFNLS